MKTKQSFDTLQVKIAAVRQELLELGQIHPGSVSQQYQVCGKPGCRCMDPKHPCRHGPYHKLAYVYRGKPVCRFVRAECIDQVKERLANYKTFRKLIDRWIELSIQQGINEFFRASQTSKDKRPMSAADPKARKKRSRD